MRSWSDVPIIRSSARDREAEKIEALDLGADDFVNKPFGVGELLSRIRTALRHRMERVAELWCCGPRMLKSTMFATVSCAPARKL